MTQGSTPENPASKSRNESERPSGAGAADSFAPLRLSEVALIAADLQELIGAQLQDCLQTASEFGLAFYHAGRTVWLWFDLQPLRPLVVRHHGTQAPKRKKISRPLTLFLKSRFMGRRLESVRADIARGRILVLSFHRAKSENEDSSPEIEVRLFPHGQNLIARDGKSSIAEIKPKEIPNSRAPDEVGEPRPWSEIEERWREWQRPRAAPEPGAAPTVVSGAERESRRQIEKKEKALVRMREELEKKLVTPYSALGEWLKTHRHLAVPPAWAELIDAKKSLAWNIENSFHRAKENVRKAEGSRARIGIVEKELAKLRQGGVKTAADETKPAANLLARAEATGRRLALAPDLDVYVGKSAADNLALLRRAQPFDYWLHLREQPGSHAILRRTRARVVTDAEFKQAGVWVVEQSLKKRASELKGERFDLLIVECRYVRPIKGDKIGRVNYTHDRVMSLRFD